MRNIRTYCPVVIFVKHKLAAIFAAAVFLGLFGFGIVFYGTNFMRKEASEIEQALLQEKPIGTQMSEIERWLRDEKNLAPMVSEVGFFKQRPPPSRVVGSRSIRARLGEYYRFPFLLRTSVVAYWGFDENNELIDIWVWKTTDAP